jgi:glycosyltransferase involved in cell wall biosynthesis
LVYHAGIDFILSQYPHKHETWSTDNDDKRDSVPLPYHRFQGFIQDHKYVDNVLSLHSGDFYSLVDFLNETTQIIPSAVAPNANSGGANQAAGNEAKAHTGMKRKVSISAVSKAGMMTPRHLFLKLDGFAHDKYADEYMDVDYCLRVRNLLPATTTAQWSTSGTSSGDSQRGYTGQPLASSTPSASSRYTNSYGRSRFRDESAISSPWTDFSSPSPSPSSSPPLVESGGQSSTTAEMSPKLEHAFDVVYDPFSVLAYYDSVSAIDGGIHREAFDPKSDDARTYAERWGSSRPLARYVRRHYDTIGLRNVSLIWNMDCGTGQVFGFTMEALYFVLGLHDLLSLHVETRDLKGCYEGLGRAGVPVSVLALLSRLSETTLESPEENNKDLYLVVHRDPGRYSHFVSETRGRSPHYIIGRSMYETDKIPDDWKYSCSNLVNEIWVPSDFNVKTFTQSGVSRSRLRQVGEAIDVYTFDPAITKPISLRQKKGFNFLTAMKWEKRKGWDVLLNAYFEEFKAEEDVALFFLSRLNDKAKEEYYSFVEKTCDKLKRKKEDLPRVVFLSEMFPYHKLPALYAGVDCFVLPTHGEGWGLPLMEAMAMELPTIATNWSGNTQFMNEENSFLLRVESMVDATTDGHKWAAPSVPHLKSLMRFVYTHPQQAKRRAKQARLDIVQNHSVDALAKRVVAQLKDIKKSGKFEEGKAANQQSSLSRAAGGGGGASWNSWNSGSSWSGWNTQSKRDESPLATGWSRIKIVEDT